MRFYHCLPLLMVTLWACSSDDEQQIPIPPDNVADGGDMTDASVDTDASVPEDASDDAMDADTPPVVELVDVAHQRELRGVWVATVSNINFPKSQSQTADQQQAALRDLLDVLVDSHCNSIFFQVRPESDAVYKSDLEPWSRFLTGTQGKDPGYDPLTTLVNEAHARGIEVHAWFNPYRAKSSKSSTAATNHVSNTLSQYAYVYDTALWMDPGATQVQDHVTAVISDVVDRYDVDGIHFDDYFYPYPTATEFPDSMTYANYVNNGGPLMLGDWRRNNVNTLVERVSAEINARKPWVRFGISPFGIYRPGMPPGISGLDQYASLYSDPVKWKAEGWVDYLAPQLYWPSTQAAQAYEPLIDWWSKLADTGRYTFAGNYLSKLDSAAAWSIQEFQTQVALSRARADYGSLGNIFFHIAPLEKNQSGIRDIFRDDLYVIPALSPPVYAQANVPVEPPAVTLEGTTVTMSHTSDVFAWVVYHDDGTKFVISSIIPAGTKSFDLPKGRHAISAAGRSMVESQGVVVEVL
jgi:uncharacterized lipoprotein YddW (UPF0748 family)